MTGKGDQNSPQFATHTTKSNEPENVVPSVGSTNTTQETHRLFAAVGRATSALIILALIVTTNASKVNAHLSSPDDGRPGAEVSAISALKSGAWSQQADWVDDMQDLLEDILDLIEQEEEPAPLPDIGDGTWVDRLLDFIFDRIVEYEEIMAEPDPSVQIALLEDWENRTGSVLDHYLGNLDNYRSQYEPTVEEQELLLDALALLYLTMTEEP